jgi:GTP-binding protein Era
MLLLNQHPDNKSITASVLGVPNAGKSTLVNCLLGMELNIVTEKPQTTRNLTRCIFQIDRAEIILVDTPGLHRSNQEFNKRMNQQAKDTAENVDINLVLLDLTRPLMEQLKDLTSVYERQLGPSWLIFNKMDLVKNAQELPLTLFFDEAKKMIPSLQKFFLLSGKKEENIHLLVGALCDAAKPGPHLYPRGEVSDKTERFFAQEFIREQAFKLLNDEIPYEVAVTVEDYKEFEMLEQNADGTENVQREAKISASILVNRPSQRAIVIGARGDMIKKIGTQARQKIEAMTGGRVHLNLHVKVAPRWFKNNMILEQLGLPRAENSDRVWRNRS